MLRFLLLHAGSESNAPAAATASTASSLASASSVSQSSSSAASAATAAPAVAAAALVRVSWFRRELALLPSLLWLTFYAPSSGAWPNFVRTISRAKSMQFILFTRPPHSSLPVHMGIWNSQLQDKLNRYKRSNETANQGKPDHATINARKRPKARDGKPAEGEQEAVYSAATMVPYTSETDALVNSARKDIAAATAETVARMLPKRPDSREAAAMTTMVAAAAGVAATGSSSLLFADLPSSSSSSLARSTSPSSKRCNEVESSGSPLSSLLPTVRVQGRQPGTDLGSLVSAASPPYLPYSERRWRQFACFLAFKFYRDQLDQHLALLQAERATIGAVCANEASNDHSHPSMPVSTSAAAASSASSAPLSPTADFPPLSCTCGVVSSPLSARPVASVLQCVRPCLSRLLSFMHSSLRCTLFLQPESPPFPLFLFALPHMSEEQMLTRNRPLRKCMQILRLCDSRQDLQYHAASDSGLIVKRSYWPREKALLNERATEETTPDSEETDVDIDNSSKVNLKGQEKWGKESEQR